MRNKLWLLGLLSAAVYGMNLRMAGVLVQFGILDSLPDPILSYWIQIVPLGIMYLLAVRVTTHRLARKTLIPIILFGLLFRLPLIPLEPVLSSDVYRYLWEGKVQVVAGLSPYVVPPADDRLAFMRDEAIFPHINRKESPTVYPAGAQLIFALAHRAGVDNPQAFKVLSLAADALTLVLLLLILKQLRLPLNRVIIYTWNPLIIYEFFWSGHLDILILPPLLGFVYLSLRGRVIAAGAALGLAVAIKLVPIFLLAAVPAGKRVKTAIPLISMLGIVYVFYLDAGSKILGFLPTYFSDSYEIFNLGVVQLGLLWGLELFSLPLSWIRLVLFALLFGILVLISRRGTHGAAEVVERSYLALSAYLLLIYPAFHPWYLGPLVPLLCFVPSPAWMFFSLLLPLSYFKYLTPDGTMPLWMTLAEFVPLYLLLIYYGKIPISLRDPQPSSAGARGGFGQSICCGSGKNRLLHNQAKP